MYTWGWKECVPSGKVFGDPTMGLSLDKDAGERQGSFMTDQGTFHLASLLAYKQKLLLLFTILYIEE